MQKPRILHVYKDYYPPVLGGIETTINLMARGSLASYEVSVLVCSGSGSRKEEVIEGVRVIRVPEMGRMASAPLSPAFIGALGREARTADLLHFHHPNPTGDAAEFLVRSRKPAVMTYHSDVVRQKKLMLLYGPLQHYMMRRCSVIMPTSPNYVESSNWLQQYRDKCRVVPLGIDMSRFAKTGDVAAAADEIRSQRPGPTVLFVGRLRYYKGLHFLLQAMCDVPATLLIGGSGPEEERLRSMIRDLGLHERVVLLGDLSEPQLVAHLYAADIFCMPSHLRSEAFGLSQLEAMACRLPVVSTRVESGVPFVNKDGESGITVPPGNPAALATAMRELLNDHELRSRLGQGARQRAHSMFTAEVMCKAVDDVYRTLL